MTDERTEGADSGVADVAPPPTLPDELKDTPEPAEPTAQADDTLPDADMVADADTLTDADAADTADVTATDGEPTADEPEDEGRRRPPLAVIIVAVLLLVAIGAGLAFLIPSGSVRQVDQLIPTNAPTVADEAGAAGDVGAVPTALPLPQVAAGDSADVIAQVGDGSILRGDFARVYQPGSDPTELLNQLIQVELVVQAGTQEGVATDAAALTTQIEEIKLSQAGGDQARFEEFLVQAQIGSEENLRRLLARDQIVEAMILRHTTGEQVHARHILIATENISDTTAARLQAEDLMKQLDGGADFAALAAENSADTGSAANGGDLGWALKGAYVPEFDEALFAMKPGERRLVQTQFGFHIIELLEPTETGPLKSSELLQTPPGQQAFAESFIPWVEGLRIKADEAKTINILIPAEQLVMAAPAP